MRGTFTPTLGQKLQNILTKKFLFLHVFSALKPNVLALKPNFLALKRTIMFVPTTKPGQTPPKMLLNRVVGSNEEQEEINKMAHGVMDEQLSKEVFSSYQCQSLDKPEIKKHPGDIVEAGCLAAQPLPQAKYPLFDSVPTEAVENGRLSDLQLEGVLYACQRHQIILPNEQRAGFFVGDGAGVGKGRQISGIILDNYARGRCKHIWFSISSDLKVDAQRDLSDIGCFIKVIEGCQQLDKETKVFGLPADCKEGVVFSTYATLVSSVQKGSGRQTRLQQLMDWCGGDKFDGCLIFDECHKAKHFIPGKEESSTKVALAVTTIQRMLPKARVVYCSATGVTDVKNMAFMERLGLWGAGTAFRSFQSFLESITKRGLGAAEMLAMEMKASGMYVSRGLSFRQAEFMNVEAVLTEEQIKVYNTSVHVWNEIKKSLEYAIARTKSATPRVWSQFWSSHQRFFKQLCMSMKVPTIVKEAKTALQNDRSVVIGLQTTGEASLESELNRNGGTVNKFISITEEIMTRFIKQFFPTKLETKDGTVLEDKWSVAAKSLLLGFVKKIGLPVSPLDDLIDQLGGPGHVAEMTGRRGRVVRTASDREPHYEARESDNANVESLNIQERNSFMDGLKFVAIISDAASTGISLHSDLRVANQRRRVHLTMELPWSADKAVQQLGRSHRSNQSSGPVYKLVTTNLGGERRFAAAVARRLQFLGALTKGDRRAATGADLTEFNFDTNYGRSALRSMYQSISTGALQAGVILQNVLAGAQISTSYELEKFNETLKECLQMMGLTDPGSCTVKEKDSGDVARFLNRILGLSVERQNMFFSYFVECMHAVIEAAKREGKFNEGVTDITGSSITMIDKPRPVFTEVQKCIMPTHHVVLNVDRGVDWESALSRFNQSYKGDLDGFYCSKREQKHQRFYLLALQKESSTYLFNIIRPNTGQSPFEEEKKDLLHKYQKISPEEAEIGWKGQYEKTKDYCFHGPQCKSGALCKVGCRMSQVSLLCGGIVPILSTLEWVVARNADKIRLTRENRTLRVVRVELDDGQRLVGLRYPEQLISEVTSLLKEQQINDSLLENKSGVLSLKDSLKTTTRSTEESVVPVNSKTLAKAINPPITIKNFFLPIENHSKTDSNTVVENPECNVVDLKHVDNPELIIDNNADTTNFLKGTKLNGALTSSYFSVPKSENTSSKVGTISSGPKTVGSNRGRPKITSGKTSLKRPMSDTTGSSTKRQKQSSIFSSLGRGRKNDVTVARKSSMTCPICGKVFDEETKNADVNAHVDSCLIE